MTLINGGTHRAGQLDTVIQQQLRLNQPSGAFRQHNVLTPLPPPPPPPAAAAPPPTKGEYAMNYITLDHYF